MCLRCRWSAFWEVGFGGVRGFGRWFWWGDDDDGGDGEFLVNLEGWRSYDGAAFHFIEEVSWIANDTAYEAR